MHPTWHARSHTIAKGWFCTVSQSPAWLRSSRHRHAFLCLWKRDGMPLERVRLRMQAPAGNTGMTGATTAPQYTQQTTSAGYPTIGAPAKTVT